MSGVYWLSSRGFAPDHLVALGIHFVEQRPQIFGGPVAPLILEHIQVPAGDPVNDESTLDEIGPCHLRVGKTGRCQRGCVKTPVEL
jgi:hypothetical protein